MSTYDKKSLLNNRYQLLASSSIYTYEDENLTSYAEFLRKFGRYIGKDGFVDAEQAIHRASLKQKQMERQQGRSLSESGASPKLSKKTTTTTTTTTSGGGASAAVVIGGSSASGATGTTKVELTSVDIASVEPERAKTFERHLKVIEDQMIQSKQGERALKRKEGDVKKELRQVRQIVREFDNTISKKRFEADKSLAKNLDEKKVLEVESAYQKENKTKERTEQNIDVLVQSKDKGRRTLLVCNDLSRQYKLKMNELDLKQVELNHLHSDFEQRIRRKEEEETRVKKEIAEIALALNMETIKAKTDLVDFKKMVESNKEKQIKADLAAQSELDENIAKSSSYVKNYDLTRRRLSAEAEQEKAHWSVRQREANRRIVDTRNNLETIYQRQRSLNEAAQIADQERKAAGIDKKIEEITQRRQTLAARALAEKLERSEEHETLFKSKATHKLTELQVKDHEDHLKHFQKLVQRDDDLEQDLYKTVKEAEFQRRKKDNELRKMQEDFIDLKKQNAVRIKEMIANAYAAEQEFQQRILKEKAKLDKHQADREETYLKLISHRERVKEDKFLLENHEKEHMRLLRVVDKNKAAVSQQI